MKQKTVKAPAKSPVKKPAKKRAKAGTGKQSASDRKKVFIEAYIANGENATEAAIAAGYSEKTAYSQGGRLLKDVEVQKMLQDRREGLAKKYELTTDVVIRSISNDLHFDPAKLYKAGGQLKDVTELDEDIRLSLSSIEFEQLGSPDAPVFVRKYKWSPKHQAREQAMKHLGMFEKDNQQKGLGMLSDLPRETIKAIAEHLKKSNGKQ